MSVLDDVIIPGELFPLPVHFVPVECGGEEPGGSTVKVFFYPVPGGWVFNTVFYNSDLQVCMSATFVPNTGGSAPE